MPVTMMIEVTVGASPSVATKGELLNGRSQCDRREGDCKIHLEGFAPDVKTKQSPVADIHNQHKEVKNMEKQIKNRKTKNQTKNKKYKNKNARLDDIHKKRDKNRHRHTERLRSLNEKRRQKYEFDSTLGYPGEGPPPPPRPKIKRRPRLKTAPVVQDLVNNVAVLKGELDAMKATAKAAKINQDPSRDNSKLYAQYAGDLYFEVPITSENDETIQVARYDYTEAKYGLGKGSTLDERTVEQARTDLVYIDPVLKEYDLETTYSIYERKEEKKHSFKKYLLLFFYIIVLLSQFFPLVLIIIADKMTSNNYIIAIELFGLCHVAKKLLKWRKDRGTKSAYTDKTINGVYKDGKVRLVDAKELPSKRITISLELYSQVRAKVMLDKTLSMSVASVRIRTLCKESYGINLPRSRYDVIEQTALLLEREYAHELAFDNEGSLFRLPKVPPQSCTQLDTTLYTMQTSLSRLSVKKEPKSSKEKSFLKKKSGWYRSLWVMALLISVLLSISLITRASKESPTLYKNALQPVLLVPTDHFQEDLEHSLTNGVKEILDPWTAILTRVSTLGSSDATTVESANRNYEEFMKEYQSREDTRHAEITTKLRLLSRMKAIVHLSTSEAFTLEWMSLKQLSALSSNLWKMRFTRCPRSSSMYQLLREPGMCMINCIDPEIKPWPQTILHSNLTSQNLC